MSQVSAKLAAIVVERAHRRCEYCGLAQAGQEATFHVDHVTPRAANGRTDLDNLALACVSCSLRKAARTHVVDSDTAIRTPLYNPRTQRWCDHFGWREFTIVGLTPVGRATIAALSMNRPMMLAIREEEFARGRHPPPTAEG